jgi:hypothetical protein
MPEAYRFSDAAPPDNRKRLPVVNPKTDILQHGPVKRSLNIAKFDVMWKFFVRHGCGSAEKGGAPVLTSIDVVNPIVDVKEGRTQMMNDVAEAQIVPVEGGANSREAAAVINGA